MELEPDPHGVSMLVVNQINISVLKCIVLPGQAVRFMSVTVSTKGVKFMRNVSLLLATSGSD